MAYQLQSMLKIRGMRQDRAQTELAGARIARAAAEREMEEKKETRAKFEETKEERRDAAFDTVIGRVVSLDDIDSVRSAVARIDEEGMLLEEAEHRATDEFQAKDRAAEGARVRFVAATKDKAKIDEHRKAWEEEDRKLQEMLADAEMEEFTGRRMISDDDDTFD